jgi:hypothetical protein
VLGASTASSQCRKTLAVFNEISRGGMRPAAARQGADMQPAKIARVLPRRTGRSREIEFFSSRTMPTEQQDEAHSTIHEEATMKTTYRLLTLAKRKEIAK